MTRCRSAGESGVSDRAVRSGRGGGISDGSQRRIVGRSGGQLFSESGSSVREPHLDPGFGQLGALRQLFPGVNVWILGTFERLFQFVQLIGGEGGAGTTLFAFQRNSRFAFAV